MHDSQLKGLQKKFENLRNRYNLQSTAVERETVLQKSLYYIDDW